jgi:hypothetical protein
MSIPGEAKGKYTHEVRYVRSRCGLLKVGVAVFVLFVVGMLIAIMCNVGSMRRRQDEMFRQIDDLRWRLNSNANNE